MTSRRDNERRIAELEKEVFSAPGEQDGTTIELTTEVQAAMREVLRYRREKSCEEGEPLELTKELVQEALENMDSELAQAVREATLRE